MARDPHRRTELNQDPQGTQGTHHHDTNGITMTDDIAELAARVRRLEDIEAARGVFLSYSRVFDAPDADRVIELFTPDATLTTPVGAFKGHEEIRGFYAWAIAAEPSVKRHLITNPQTTSLGGGQVRIESDFLFLGVGDTSVVGWGSYDDVVDVSGDRPLFAEKTIKIDVATDLEKGWANQPVGEA